MEEFLKLLEKIDSNPSGWEAMQLWFALILICALALAVIYLLGMGLALIVGNIISHFQKTSTNSTSSSTFKDRPNHGPKY